jgi:hypothetical protein
LPERRQDAQDGGPDSIPTVALDRYSNGTTCKSLSLEALGVVALASNGLGATTPGVGARGAGDVGPVSFGADVGWTTCGGLDPTCFTRGFNFCVTSGSDLSTHPTDIAEFELNKCA